MYPVGFLFGLGFDTATQIAFYAATLAAQQVSVWAIMIFPALFTAGMCLIDTTDGIVMLGAYGWAFVKPMRKLFYNMTITFISFLIAFLIGGLEVLSIIGSKLQAAGEENGQGRPLTAMRSNPDLVGVELNAANTRSPGCCAPFT